MLPPIFICKNGHSICEKCKLEPPHCPTCTVPFTNIRSVSLEKLSTYMEFPCIYRGSGCNESVRSENINEHQSMCPYVTYICPLQCPGRFNTDHLLEHVQQQHSIALNYYGDGLRYNHVMNYDFKKNYVNLITAQNDYFVSTISVTNNIWEFFLMYIGPESRAGRFSYTLQFGTGNVDLASIKITLRCTSINKGFNEIRQACKCIILPVDVIKSLVEDGNMVYYLRIGRAQ